jgi:hypothetical protein
MVDSHGLNKKTKDTTEITHLRWMEGRRSRRRGHTQPNHNESKRQQTPKLPG